VEIEDDFFVGEIVFGDFHQCYVGWIYWVPTLGSGGKGRQVKPVSFDCATMIKWRKFHGIRLSSWKT
jgi:hypothetical protein